MTPEVKQLAADIRATNGRINAAVHGLVEHAMGEAAAERDYRKAKAQAWVKVDRDGTTAAEREAMVDASTADEGYERDVSKGMWKAALEALRARSQELSSLQSLLKVEVSEADLAKYGPDMGADQ